MPTNQTIQTIDEDGITLVQLLKLAGVAGSGGEAKQLVDAGQITVNGETELRKRRQLAVGDVVGVVDGPSIKLA